MLVISLFASVPDGSCRNRCCRMPIPGIKAHFCWHILSSILYGHRNLGFASSLVSLSFEKESGSVN